MIVICLYYISLNGWYNVFNFNKKVKIVYGNVFEYYIFFWLFLKIVFILFIVYI